MKKKLTIYFPIINGYTHKTFIVDKDDVMDVEVFPDECACVVTFKTYRVCYYNMPHVLEDNWKKI